MERLGSTGRISTTGITIPFLFAWFNIIGMFSFKSIYKKVGLIIFTLGFVLSELIIVSQLEWRNMLTYYKVLFIVSQVLWIGMLLLFPLRRYMPKSIMELRRLD